MINLASTTGSVLGSVAILQGEGLSSRMTSHVERQRDGWYVRLYPTHPCYRTVERDGLLFHDVVPFIQRSLRDEFFVDHQIAFKSLCDLTDWMKEQESLFQAAKSQSVPF